MIEVPRAAVTADEIAEEAEFFSFGTNDLTQMTFGYSRDDAGTLPAGLPGEGNPGERSVPEPRPGRRRQAGRRSACEKGRTTRPDLKVRHLRRARRRSGVGGVLPPGGLDYVSCSPFRVPIARLAAAQANIESPRRNGTERTRDRSYVGWRGQRLPNIRLDVSLGGWRTGFPLPK